MKNDISNQKSRCFSKKKDSVIISPMEFLKVIILGVIEGLTEFIPVSSTGHLIIVEDFLKLNSDNTHTFQIAIQLGAILAVLFSYQEKIRSLLTHSVNRVHFLKLLVTAALPVFVIGFLCYDYIKEQLFSPITVAMALIVGAIAMILVELKPTNQTKTDKIETITIKQALYVGCFQVISLWPGMSRSGSTIIGGLFVNLSHRTAADFSFLLALPVISAAVLYDLLKSFNQLTPNDIVMILIGGIVSFIVALFAIKTFLIWLEKVRLFPFAIYRIILAIIVLVLYV